MRRVWMVMLCIALLLSLTLNGVLGWAAYRAGTEYRALARQLVKVKDELAAVKKAATVAATAAVAPVVADGPADAAPEPLAAAPVGAAPEPPAGAPVATAPKPLAPSPGGEQAVRQAFEPRFLTVQTQCEGRLDQLLSDAKAEYQREKAANGGKVDIGALGARYYPKADALRRDCDRSMEALLGQMTTELRQAGLSTALVGEVREAYEARIVERQAEILAKIDK